MFRFKKISIYFAILFVFVLLTVLALLFRFTNLPNERSYRSEEWIALSPFEWSVLSNLDSQWQENFDSSKIPDIYSGLKTPQSAKRETPRSWVEQMRQWMVFDLSKNRELLYQELLSPELRSKAVIDFEAVMNDSYASALEVCAPLKVERAYRSAALNSEFRDQILDYLSKCNVSKDFLLMTQMRWSIEDASENSKSHQKMDQQLAQQYKESVIARTDKSTMLYKVLMANLNRLNAILNTD